MSTESNTAAEMAYLAGALQFMLENLDTTYIPGIKVVDVKAYKEHVKVQIERMQSNAKAYAAR